MASAAGSSSHHPVGSWAKRLYLTSRSVMDALLRPYGLGSTQWYVLHQLVNHGPTLQRDMAELFHIERATLSSVVATLVRKGLVTQVPDTDDQRQRILRMTRAGSKLWAVLPDPIERILMVAFDGVDAREMEIAQRVLQGATQRLNQHDWGEGE